MMINHRAAQWPETSAGWVKYEHNPVLGGELGTCFDLTMFKEGEVYRMWFSWRPKQSVALVESRDGIHWSEPVIVVGPDFASGWEVDINRPSVVKRGDSYHMWYTGQVWGEIDSLGHRLGQSYIGHAVSQDGVHWQRTGSEPVLSPTLPWEKVAVMCPQVIWDEEAGIFKMWYSGGEQYEPDAIGYATSRDGRIWEKDVANPIFQCDPQYAWEHYKVAGCQVIREGEWYIMFYIGFADLDHARIGLARSRNGISDWERHPANPIIGPGDEQAWDHDATYKPFAIHEPGRWVLWYNGRHGAPEQIGYVIHEGDDLQFDKVSKG